MYPSIKKFDELSKTRKDPTFWADNIIQSEMLCNSDEERKHFYMYIMNPKQYTPDSVKRVVTLGDLEKEGKLVDDIKKYPPGVETQVYTNGSEITLCVKTRPYEPESDDEKKVPEEEDEKHLLIE